MATLKTLPKNATILIDMILYNEISLKNKHISKVRAFDRFAKEELGKWHSQYLQHRQRLLKRQSYLEACKLSKAICAKCLLYNALIFSQRFIRQTKTNILECGISSRNILKVKQRDCGRFKKIHIWKSKESPDTKALGYLQRTNSRKDSKTKWEDDLLDALALLITAIKRITKNFTTDSLRNFVVLQGI